MIVIYEKDELCIAPDCMNSGDTIIVNDKIYQITTKTWDNDNSDLYCKVVVLNEDKNIVKLLNEIYESPTFKTSGFNTNNVNSNPRILSLMAVCTAIINEDHMKTMGPVYKDRITQRWNSKEIEWDEIFFDNPPIKADNVNKIISNSAALLKMSRIADNLWPPLIQRAYHQS